MVGVVDAKGGRVVDSQPKKRVRKTKEERQREIAEITLRLIGKYGLRGTTVSRISAAVGLSRGALYQHFRNRQAVIEAAIGIMTERPLGWIEPPTTQKNLLRHLQELGRRHAAWAESESEAFVRPFFELIASADKGHLSAPLAEGQRKILRMLVTMIEEGKGGGGINPEADSQDLAWALLMFAWSEDVAKLMGVDEFIARGSSTRNLHRMLAPAEPSLSVQQDTLEK